MAAAEDGADRELCSGMGMLSWLMSEPAEATVEEDGAVLRFRPETGLDYWRNTYYKPTLLKHDGHWFGVRLADLLPGEAGEPSIVAEARFSLNPHEQFDQCGIMLGCLDDETTWIKTGIEFVDGESRLSAVVTNNGFSDWSTQRWDYPRAEFRLRLYLLQDSLVVEAREDEDAVDASDGATGPRAFEEWKFVRIAHLNVVRDGEADASGNRTMKDLAVGIFGCSPTRGGECTVTAREFTVRTTKGFHHTTG